MSNSGAKGEFNNENVWDDRRNLFSLYFADTFEEGKHYMVYLNTKETAFDAAVSNLKDQYRVLKPNGE